MELCRCTDGYGHQRTSTDDKPAGALRQASIHHKLRNDSTTGRVSWCATIGLIGLIRLIGQPLRYALPVRGRDNQLIITTSRLSGIRRTTGATPTADRRNHTLPLACWATAQRQAPQPAGFVQGRYRAAIREFCRGVRDRRVLTYATGAATTARLARASENAP